MVEWMKECPFLLWEEETELWISAMNFSLKKSKQAECRHHQMQHNLVEERSLPEMNQNVMPS